MVLTAAQNQAFFQDADQMGIPAATVAQLAIEGMATVESLAGFDKETLSQLADNLRRPGGRIPDPNPAAAAGASASGGSSSSSSSSSQAVNVK